MNIKGQIIFPHRYIAEPYWPEMAQIIDIDKQSGVSRARSEQARSKALDAHLKKIGMTYEDFETLKRKALRPFHTVSDVQGGNGHAADEIVIPTDRMLACFTNACDVAPSAIRICKPEQLRSIIHIEHIYTGKTAPDGSWIRAVIPKKDGKPLSNQRGTRTSQYIENFSGDLVVTFDESFVAPKRLKEFIEWAGREIGVGASRKMNNGRFSVKW